MLQKSVIKFFEQGLAATRDDVYSIRERMGLLDRLEAFYYSLFI